MLTHVFKTTVLEWKPVYHTSCNHRMCQAFSMSALRSVSVNMPPLKAGDKNKQSGHSLRVNNSGTARLITVAQDRTQDMAFYILSFKVFKNIVKNMWSTNIYWVAFINNGINWGGGGMPARRVLQSVPETGIFTPKLPELAQEPRIFTRSGASIFTLELDSEPPIFHLAAAHTYQNLG